MGETVIIKPHKGFQEKFVRSNVDVVIGGGQLGGGKENPLYTNVLTPKGWVQMGDLKVGDFVSTPFGEPTKVLQIFDHKAKDIYRIVTSDGRVCEAGFEHLWAIRTEEQKAEFNKHKDFRKNLSVCDTATLLKMLDDGKKIYIPIPFAQEFTEKEYEFSPIEIGTNICTTHLSNKDYIPEEYFWGSIEQRKQLLSTIVGFTNLYISDRLCSDIVYLCRSLGYVATVNKVCNLNSITISLDDHVYIKSIEKIGVNDTRCIFVEDDMHLYIIDDFVTTHNTFGAALMMAEPSLDPRFRAVCLRNNLDDLKAGGGMLDIFRECYGSGVKVVESGNPHVDFGNGARVDVTHIADQTKKKLEQRFKGRQYDLVYFDELTGFTWECFCFLFSRNRGKASWTGKIRATTNPKRNHWLRKFLDWYIGIDGEIRPDRDGIVRYFFNSGESVEDVVWGDSKEEVYMKAKIKIDRFLANFNGKTGTATYKDVIKSFTYYLGRTSENVALGDGYAGSVAAMGGRSSAENAGNWNVDTEQDEDAVIVSERANYVFLADDQRNGDRWVTCDLADSGTDNFLAIAWDGFHIFDIIILNKTTPRDNAEYLKMFAEKHRVSDTHIIYDATRGLYINDYIPDAVPYLSSNSTRGMYGRMALRLKDECYMRLVEMIKRGGLSMDDAVANKQYTHANLKERVTIQNEFIEECAVVRFKDAQSGRKTLMTKKEMNKLLGRGRSMDLLDPMAMRMLPVLHLPYGDELSATLNLNDTTDNEDDDFFGDSIFDDATWY